MKIPQVPNELEALGPRKHPGCYHGTLVCAVRKLWSWASKSQWQAGLTWGTKAVEQ